MASSQNHFISREEYKAKRALDEARKAGKLPAEVDEEGKEINPHMPQYITQAPWYLNQTQPSLKHHRARNEIQGKINIDMVLPRGLKSSLVVSKFRKGACENCGANTHKTKECCERPRKIKAKHSQQNFAPDEIYADIPLDYDGKRDRWNGYDPSSYSQIIEDFQEFEKVRHQQKFQELNTIQQEEIKKEDDEYKLEDKEDVLMAANPDPKIKTTIRNLRIREDTAKYLYNLSDASAFYDPKSRSMRENPTPHLSEKQQPFKGDNFYKFQGDATKFLHQEKFAWDIVDKKKSDLNSLGLPTITEVLYKKVKDQEGEQKHIKNKEMAEKYGVDIDSQVDYGIILGQTEQYVEYTRDGRIKNINDSKPKSKYLEDQYINNHSSVWGSWWNEELGWGYKCCHCNEKQSNCLGEKGKQQALKKEYLLKKAKEEELKKLEDQLAQEQPQQNQHDIHHSHTNNILNNNSTSKKHLEQEIQEKNQEKLLRKISDSSQVSASSSSSSVSDSSSSSSSDSSESESEASSILSSPKRNKDKTKRKQSQRLKVEKLDRKKLKEALKHEEKAKERAKTMRDDRKRPYNSFKANDDKVTAEELEAYHLKKQKFNDPLSNMKL